MLELVGVMLTGGMGAGLLRAASGGLRHGAVRQI